MSAPAYRYWAFLSYSHQDNRETRDDGTRGCVRWAEWLHEALENYRVPPEFLDRATAVGESMPDRFFPVFQDEKELPLNANLARAIQTALEQSRFLIVICSPRSALSQYVNEEVRVFKQLGRADRILTLMIDGEPNASDGHKPGVDPRRECFCPALRHPLDAASAVDTTRRDAQEPIAGDVRVKSGGPAREAALTEIRAHRPVLDYMRLKLLAGLMGVGFDELVNRDASRQRTRNRRNFALLAAVALIFAALAGWAWQQRSLAVAKGREAVENFDTAKRNEAEAKRNATLAGQEAQKALDRERQAKAALSMSDFYRADELIESGNADHALAYLARAVRGDASNHAAGRRLLFLLQERPWFLPSASELPVEIQEHDARRAEAALAAVLRAATDRPRDPLGSGEPQAVVSPSGQRFIGWGMGWKGARYYRLKPEIELIRELGVTPNAVDFIPSTEEIVAGSGTTSEFGDSGAVTFPNSEAKLTTSCDGVRVAPDGRHVVTLRSDRVVNLWTVRGDAIGEIATDEAIGNANAIDFSADGRRLHVGAARFERLGRDPVALGIEDEPLHGEPARGLVRVASEPAVRLLLPDGDYDRATSQPREPFYRQPLAVKTTGRTIPLEASAGLDSATMDLDGTRVVGLRAKTGEGFVWDAATGKLRGQFTAEPRSEVETVTAAHFATSTSASLQVWTTETLAKLGQPLPASGRLSAVHPDGVHVLVSGHKEGTTLWNSKTAEPVGDPIPAPDDVSARFSPDGSFFVVSLTGSGYGVGEFALYDTGTARSLTRWIASRDIVAGEGGEAPVLGEWHCTAQGRLFLAAEPSEMVSEPSCLIFDVPAVVALVPAWLADLGEITGGSRLTSANSLRRVPDEERRARLARLRESLAQARADDRYASAVRWWLDDSPQRLVAPGVSLTVRDFVERRLRSEKAWELSAAGLAAPEDARIFARHSALLAAEVVKRTRDADLSGEWRADEAIAIEASARRARRLDPQAKLSADSPPPAPAAGTGDAAFARGEALRTAKDFAAAVSAYHRAAGLGHAGAQNQLGIMHAKGEGVLQNDAEAVAWYLKAAQQGHAEAQFLLGVRLILGKGVAKDESAGLGWYRKAAAQGHAGAIEVLTKRGLLP